MKKIIILLGSVLTSISCPAQRPGEWINQQNTQTKYLQQQIALLQVYLGYVQKGYSISQAGLTTIGNSKDREWQLHIAYISSLDKVNPFIRNSPQVAAILSSQFKIQQTCQSTLQQVKQNNHLPPAEFDYIQLVMANLLRESAWDAEELLTVLTANQWKMTDPERLKRVEALYESMLAKQAWAQQFSNEVKVLSSQRMKDQNAIQTSRSLYGF
jgi:hypothetical protein